MSSRIYSTYFISQFRVPLLLWMLLIASTSSEKIKVNWADAGIITSFLEKIIKPYINSNQLIGGKPRAKLAKEIIMTEIENIIRLKVIELKPMLQDSENNFKPEESDETIIIEFVPEKLRKSKTKSALRKTKQDKDTLKDNIGMYKQLKQHIQLLVDKEKTSSLTNKMITRTLDKMLTLLIKRQCKWTSVDSGDLMNYLLRNNNKIMQKIGDKSKVVDHYKLTCYMRRSDKAGDGEYYNYPGGSQHYLGSPRYGLAHKKSSDRTKDGNNIYINQCDRFIVCSGELREFLRIIYNHWNDTAVSIFKNYAAMYIRDVKEDTEPVKDIVNSELEDLSKDAEKQVNQIFASELERFTLDENKKKAANIHYIKKFIEATSGQIKSSLNRLVKEKSSNIEIKLYSIIKQDLLVNLKVDMDNLSHLIADKICSFFVLCNAQGSRRIIEPQSLKPMDTENVYVKVQLSFDSESNNSSARFVERNKNSWQEDNTTYRSGKRFIDASDQRKYSYVNITRTTISSAATTEGLVSSEHRLAEQFFK